MGLVNSMGPKGTHTATYLFHISGIRGQKGERDLPKVTQQIQADPTLRSRSPALHVFTAWSGSPNLSGSAETSCLKPLNTMLLKWNHIAFSFLTGEHTKVL